MIPYSTQTIEDSDIEAVLDAVKSPYLTCGPAVRDFEDAVCNYTSCNYAIAVNSCTSALHLAMLAFGVSSGDLVYVSAISFVASSNCALYAGAEVDFVDVDKDTGNMDLDCLEQMLIEAKKVNRLPKVVVAVHLSGRAVDLERLYRLKNEYGFYLLEDAAHATGAVYKGSKIGSCKYSDITVFSFHPVKIITTCEGGMCLTNDEKLASLIQKLSSHGIVHDKSALNDKSMPAFYYEMQDLGFNYRISDLQCALGLSQLEKIDSLLEKRRAQAAYYPTLLSDSKLILPQADTPDSISSWHLYQVLIPDGRRDEVYTKMRQRNIGVQVH
ncbi:MAG: UDP-4-amino-4,6-dideoxy-N-acetyl-beta-L-altrosamine transaminase, partial [Succinivibrio sp.]